MKILVTGGRGFIGSHVADWAGKAGHEVAFFDKREGNDILGDLGAMTRFKPDAVIHLAGVLGTMELFETIEDAIEKNVLGSYRVAQWCSAHDAQYVGILVPDVFPSIYCATKVGAHRITSAMTAAGRLRSSHVIAYNAHGPGQAYGPGHPRKFGPTFSISAWNNQPIPIWGDGSALVDPVPVSVVARMLVDACSFGEDQVFDGGLGIEVTVQEIAEEVLKITGSSAGIAYEPMRIGETPTNVAATGRGWDLLDWHPRDMVRALHDGNLWTEALRETVESYRGVPFVGEYQSGFPRRQAMAEKEHRPDPRRPRPAEPLPQRHPKPVTPRHPTPPVGPTNKPPRKGK